jgi:hypothetical protein
MYITHMSSWFVWILVSGIEITLLFVYCANALMNDVCRGLHGEWCECLSPIAVTSSYGSSPPSDLSGPRGAVKEEAKLLRITWDAKFSSLVLELID